MVEKMKKRLGLSCVVFLFLFLLFGCEGDAGLTDPYGSPDSGSIAFSVQWPDEAASSMHSAEGSPSPPRMSAAPVRLSDDCERRGVDKVRLAVKDSTGATLNAALFDCEAGRGRLTDIEPQANCAVVVSGLDFSGNVAYEGRKSGIAIYRGLNNVGTILVERIGDQLPEANITAPSDNSIYTHGDIVSFTGTGMDPEDGALPASAFVWESSLDGVIETGSKAFSTDFLSAGNHIVTLTVSDSGGATDSAAINVIIRAGMPPGDISNAMGMTFNYIEPGTFMMGSPENEPGRKDDEDRHQVSLSHGFYMQTTPVTQGQWKSLMGENPSAFSDCGSDCPVENVSWHDVQDFIEELNALEGKKRYVLPTEAQWEYAARAGSTTAFANGPITDPQNDTVLDHSGWYSYNSNQTPKPVAQKDPNAWGLYDNHGNVYEWVSSWYGDYPSSASVDPTGPSSGTARVIRGGSWQGTAANCRAGNRETSSPASRGDDIGFRLALLPDPAKASQIVWADIFEDGWGDWHAEKGIWQVGKPGSGPDSGPGSTHAGTNVAGTVLDGNYTRDSDSRMVSPAVTLPSVIGDESVVLRFWQWYAYATFGQGEVQASMLADEGWSDWETLARPAGEGSSGWSRSQVDLTAYAGHSVRIAFYHRAHVGATNWYPTDLGWYIDSVEIRHGLLQVAWPETFEGGWGDWYAEKGVWQVGKPDSGPDSAHAGKNAAGTFLDGNYTRDSNSRLVSPAVTLPSVVGDESVMLRFWQWYAYAAFGQGEVQVSKRSDEGWSDWEALARPAEEGSSGWSRSQVDLTAYAGYSVRIAFYHRAHVSATNWYPTDFGWYIDSVEVLP